MTNTAELNVNTLYINDADRDQIYSWAHDAYANHDEEKLALAVLAMMPRLYTYAYRKCDRRMDRAIDAVDTAKMRILLNFFKKDVSSYFMQWCYRITAYAVVDNLRAIRGHENDLSLDETGFGNDGEDARYAFIADSKMMDSEEIVRRNDRMEDIKQVLNELGEEEKEVWTMHFVQKKTLSQIAEETEKKDTRIRYLIYTANGHVRNSLQAME